MTDILQPYDYLVRNATAIPDEIAITDGDTTLTWAELADTTKRIASELRRRGVESGDLVGLRLTPLLGCVVSWAVFHEAAAVIKHTSLLDDIDELTPRLVITDDPTFRWTSGETLTVNSEWLARLETSHIDVSPSRYPSSEAVFHYSMSSGTTGRQKITALPMSVVFERATLSLNAMGAKTLHMNLIGGGAESGFYTFMASAMAGSTYLVPTTTRGPVSLLKKYNVDVVKGSPMQLSRMASELEATRETLPHLRKIFVGGARLPEALHATLVRLTSAVIGVAYGATELLSISMRTTDSDDMSDLGTPVPGTIVEIVDPETHEPLDDGQIGLIRARGNYMPTEYIGNPEATANHLIDGWFYPGDLGMLVDGRLFLRGRVTELINAGGLKIDPNLVEEAFNSVVTVDEAAAFACPRANGIDRVAVAYVNESPIDAKATYPRLKELLGNSAPTVLFHVASLPRSEMGKVLRGELTRTLVPRERGSNT